MISSIFFFCYPPLLYLFASQIGLNLISRSWAKAHWLKPVHIWALSFIGIYLIAPSIEPESSRKCGMSIIAIMIAAIYGVVVSSIIFLVFRSKLLRDVKSP